MSHCHVTQLAYIIMSLYRRIAAASLGGLGASDADRVVCVAQPHPEEQLAPANAPRNAEPGAILEHRHRTKRPIHQQTDCVSLSKALLACPPNWMQ
jgi:hypothetical protein